MTDTTEVPAVEKPKRKVVAVKGYVIPEKDELSRHATPDAEALSFTFPDTGDEYLIALGDIGAGCVKAATFHGLAQKLGDSYAGKSGDEAVEAFETVLERLKADDWVRMGEGPGTRPSMVADAIKAAIEKGGETVDEERYARIMEKVKGPEARKAALATPAFAAEYERIKSERAAEKYAKAAAKAAEGPTDLGDY